MENVMTCKRAWRVVAGLGVGLAVMMAGCGRTGQGDAVGQGGVGDRDSLLEWANELVNTRPDSALEVCKIIMNECGPERDTIYARALLTRGNAWFAMGDLEQAKLDMASARALSRDLGDDYAYINATGDLGVAYRVSQDADSALILYQEALDAIPQGEFRSERAHLLTSLAVLYANTGRLAEARDYADKAVAAAKESEDMEMVMYATSTAGAIYNLMGDQSQAITLIHEAIAEARRLNLPRYELKAIGHLIDTHLRQSRNDSAMMYLRRGEELAREFPETSVEGLGFLEEKYVALSAMGRYRESLAVQRRLLDLQATAPTFMPPEKLWLRMARNYSALGLRDSAEVCYERSLELTDSLRGEEADEQLSEFYARFQTAEKELALAESQREKAKSDARAMTWIMVAVALILVVVTLVAYLLLRRKREALERSKAYISGIERERGRLAKDLHDGVCNDLYGIQMLLQTPTEKEALVEDVERIRADVRRISHELMPPALRDVELPQALEEMVGKLRHAYPGVDFSLEINGDGAWGKVAEVVSYNLYRVVQELIGNIMRHTSPTEVGVTLSRDHKQVQLEITHNGSEAKENCVNGRGIGLESVAERLEAIGATAQGLPYGHSMVINCPLR